MADDKRKIIKDLNDLESERIKFAQEYLDLLGREHNQFRAIYDVAYKTQQTADAIQAAEELHAAQLEEVNRLKAAGFKVSEKVGKEMDDQVKTTKELTTQQTRYNKVLAVTEKTYGKISGIAKTIWTYLMEADRVIKQTTLSLGMSGEKAAAMRESMNASAGYAARLGGSMTDIGAMMTGFANETGLARVLTESMTGDIMKMAKGTGLGVENATKLAAQFEYMGYDVKNTMDYVQGVVETSELMGVNTNKVLDNITNNFKTLQKYTFIQGVKGFAQMASYAEKFSIDMTQVLSSADGARNLEGAIDMAAQLQIMGGEFAKSDPFRLFYLSRNDPDGYMKMLNDMTKGMVTFRDMGDGTFEKFISPADRDRLASVAKTLGITTEEITEQTLRMADMQKMRQDLVGMGLSETEKEIVTGMGKYNTNLGRYQVTMGGHKKDIADLTHSEIKMLEATKSSLEDRAIAAQTFDDAFKNTIAEMKTVLLPLLTGVNAVLEWMRPTVIRFSEWVSNLTEGGKQWVKVAGIILASGFLLNKAIGGIGSVYRGVKSFGGGGKTATSALSGSQALGAGKGAGARAAGMGKGMMMGGAGIGAAALGTGAGIGAAAAGISLLADSMSKLDENQAKTLNKIIITLGVAAGVLPALAVGLMMIAPAAVPAAPAIAAVGVAALGIGAGIGIAAAGIGAMGWGLGQLAKNAKLAGPEMKQFGEGMAMMVGSLALAGPGAAFGLPALAIILNNIGKKTDKIKGIAEAFTPLATLSGMKEDFLAVEKMVATISSGNLTKLQNFSALGSLKDLLTKPLTVQFADKEVAVVSNVTLNIDGYKFYEKTKGAATIATNTKAIQQGKLS